MFVHHYNHFPNHIQTIIHHTFNHHQPLISHPSPDIFHICQARPKARAGSASPLFQADVQVEDPPPFGATSGNFMVNGMVYGKTYRKPWFLSSIMGGSWKFLPSSNSVTWGSLGKIWKTHGTKIGTYGNIWKKPQETYTTTPMEKKKTGKHLRRYGRAIPYRIRMCASNIDPHLPSIYPSFVSI